MKKKTLLLYFLFLISATHAFGQTDTLSIYRQAYNYLNDSIVKKQLADPERFSSDCEALIKGYKVTISPDLQVADKFIEHGHGFPICDFVKQKYNYKGSCGAFVVHDSGFRNQVQDSLQNYYKDYTFNEEKVKKTLRGFIANKENGYQVFFSDYYKNALAAELKSFCRSYKEGYWQGSSTSFYFIFDDNGKLIEVYSGRVIHYN